MIKLSLPLTCIFERPYYVFKVNVGVFQTTEAFKYGIVDVINFLFNLAIVSWGASQEEVPLIGVNCCISS